MTEFLIVSGVLFWVMFLFAAAIVFSAVTSDRWRTRQDRRRGLRDIEQLLKKEARR
ncbi:hypothetical protein ACGFZP_12795 [Kitasatospora sp. NPDC048239]|uniref:hypothetical protein n=1 Tax=Kitasatospora sp. NPDC048239 TaxID=3364046 RepID=UPI0037135055